MTVIMVMMVMVVMVMMVMMVMKISLRKGWAVPTRRSPSPAGKVPEPREEAAAAVAASNHSNPLRMRRHQLVMLRRRALAGPVKVDAAHTRAHRYFSPQIQDGGDVLALRLPCWPYWVAVSPLRLHEIEGRSLGRAVVLFWLALNFTSMVEVGLHFNVGWLCFWLFTSLWGHVAMSLRGIWYAALRQWWKNKDAIHTCAALAVSPWSRVRVVDSVCVCGCCV